MEVAKRVHKRTLGDVPRQAAQEQLGAELGGGVVRARRQHAAPVQRAPVAGPARQRRHAGPTCTPPHTYLYTTTTEYGDNFQDKHLFELLTISFNVWVLVTITRPQVLSLYLEPTIFSEGTFLQVNEI